MPEAKPDDVILWPDGTWCFHENRPEYSQMSDDYKTLYEGSAEWIAFFAE